LFTPSALYKLEHVSGPWLADQLFRLEVPHPEIRVVFADSRRFAEDVHPSMTGTVVVA
jgi:hypothetical protein